MGEWVATPLQPPPTEHQPSSSPNTLYAHTGPRTPLPDTITANTTGASLPSLGTGILHLLIAATTLALDARLAWACFTARAALLRAAATTTNTTRCPRGGSLPPLPHWTTRLFRLYSWGLTALPFLLLALPLQLALHDPSPTAAPTWAWILHPPTPTALPFLPYLAATWAAAAVALRLLLGLLLFTAFARTATSGGGVGGDNNPIPVALPHVEGLSRRALVYVGIGTLLSVGVWIVAAAPGCIAQLGLVRLFAFV
jgi:hypothetical protein